MNYRKSGEKSTKPYIHITKEVREKLKKQFRVSGTTLWKALFFESESDKAKRIRKAAQENYGILMNDLPCMETFHDHDNVMRQYFPNDVLVELDKNTSLGYVYLRGKKVMTYKKVMVSDIPNIQRYAEALR